MLRFAASWPAFRSALEGQIRFGTWLARTFGARAGGIGYEIEGTDGRIVRLAIVSREHSYLIAVAPAVLAACAIVEQRLPHQGLLLLDRHVEADELWKFLQANGISLTILN
jgi:hypothetical protein